MRRDACPQISLGGSSNFFVCPPNIHSLEAGVEIPLSPSFQVLIDCKEIIFAAESSSLAAKSPNPSVGWFLDIPLSGEADFLAPVSGASPLLLEVFLYLVDAKWKFSLHSRAGIL